jgi:hypothetical protein
MKYCFTLLMVVLLLNSCQKDNSEPASASENEIIKYKSGARGQNDEPEDRAAVIPYISFSNYQWIARNVMTNRQGPGPNFFSSTNVTVDVNGYLHLKIRKIQSKWVSSEVFSNDNFGYGKYIYVTKGNIEQYDKKIVVGLFTWDDNTYQAQANDELDIEFAKWGTTRTKVMEYSVQPQFTTTGSYPERKNTAAANLQYDANGFTTHIINWSATQVVYETHRGDDTTAATLTHTWSFDNTNPARATDIGGYWSNAIVIPQPGATTKAHINFWLIDYNQDGKGDTPSNNSATELIVKRFQYVAAPVIL